MLSKTADEQSPTKFCDRLEGAEEMTDKQTKRLTITGGKGFLGTHIVQEFQDHGYREISIAGRPDYDLVKCDDVQRMYADLNPDIVIHLAANVGGIGYNRENPATLLYDNLMMGVSSCTKDMSGRLKNLSPSERFAPTPNMLMSLLGKSISVMATRRKPTHPMGWQKR